MFMKMMGPRVGSGGRNEERRLCVGGEEKRKREVERGKRKRESTYWYVFLRDGGKQTKNKPTRGSIKIVHASLFFFPVLSLEDFCCCFWLVYCLLLARHSITIRISSF